MNALEFSNQFDVLYNNITSNKAPGLNGYEKSVFLTKAQYELLHNYFNEKHNLKQEGFDNTRKRKIDFRPLIETANAALFSVKHIDLSKVLDPRAVLFTADIDPFIILNEQLAIYNSEHSLERLIELIPLDLDEYTRLMSKPYKEPLKNQGWILDHSDIQLLYDPSDPNPATTKFYAKEVILTSDVKKKYLRILVPDEEQKVKPMWKSGYYGYLKIKYLKRPIPIIIEDLSHYGTTIIENQEVSILTIDGQSNVTTDYIELSESTQQEILQRAVEIAKAAWESDLKTAVQLGQRSE